MPVRSAVSYIGRLIRHIPDKHFRMVRHYGIFATRVRGTALPRVRALLGHEEPTRQDAPTWRERWAARTGIDPLLCLRCGVEMVLCHGPGEPPGIECHWCHQGLMVPLKHHFRSGEVFRLTRDVLRALRGRQETSQL